ncbi:MAG TPA: MATE family efflux transporter [Candidatus Galloscillospira stercoripullorum]|nr:MATE family efflux transporter [Candidatus Galloscillospira stercoripullorum]
MEKLQTREKENTRSGMGKGRILALTLPIFVELLLQMLVGNADQIMVGYVDHNGVGAIGNVNQITNLVILVFSVVCTAAMILISQYLGARDTRRVNQTYTLSLAANFLFGLAIGGILLTLCPLIFTAMGVPEEIFDKACLYMRIIALGMPLQALYLTFTAFFRSSQMMKETMVVSVGMNLLNIGGNAVLIYGPGPLPSLGVAGAAVSSCVSRLIGLVVIAVLFRLKFGPVLSVGHLRPFPRDLLGKLLSIGIPTAGESISYNLSQVVIQTICNGFAIYVINTRVYANMFAMMTYMFASAMSQATQVVAARLMGAGDVEGTDRQVRATLRASVLISGAVSVLLFLLSRPLYGLFTQDEQVLSLAWLIMLIEIPLELGRAVNMVMCRSLQACGDIRFPIAICVFSAWVTAVGGSLLLGVALGWGLAGLWAAMAADECLRAGLFIWRWRSGVWSRKRLLG